MPNSIAVIGDIHGDVVRLRRALEELTATSRELVFVGDYIDRGPCSQEVITTLIELGDSRPDVTFLRGNHESALLEWLNGGSIGPFIQQGGLTTIASYVSQPGPGVFEDLKRDFPARHRDFLECTRSYYENPGLFISHAGYDPTEPDNRDSDVLIYGRHATLFPPPNARPQELVVFGHYVQPSRQPYDQDGIICLDTGCGTLSQGPLTVLLLPEHKFLQF